MTARRILAACSIVFGAFLLASDRTTCVVAQSNDGERWILRETSAGHSGERESATKPRTWKAVHNGARPLRPVALRRSRSERPVSPTSQRSAGGWSIGTQLQRLRSFRWSARPAGRRATAPGSRHPRTATDSHFPVLQADADWDDLQTDPPSTPQEPQSPATEPQPVAPLPAAPQSAPPPEPEPEQRIPLAEYHNKDIRDINPHDILPPPGAQLPRVETVPSGGLGQRERELELFHWQASGLKYYPLYFEDMPLERYGHSLGCLQPLWSTGQFYAQVLLWPYEMGLDPPCKPLYALGYERPGDCTPRLWYQVPVNPEAAVSEAAAWTLFMVIFP